MSRQALRVDRAVRPTLDVLSGSTSNVRHMDPFVAYHQTRIAARLVDGAVPGDLGPVGPLYVCVSTRHRIAIECLTRRVSEGEAELGENVFDDHFLRERGRPVRFPDEAAFDALQLGSGALAAFLLVRPSEVTNARHWFATWPEFICTSAPTIELCRVRHR